MNKMLKIHILGVYCYTPYHCVIAIQYVGVSYDMGDGVGLLICIVHVVLNVVVG